MPARWLSVLSSSADIFASSITPVGPEVGENVKWVHIPSYSKLATANDGSRSWLC